MTTTVAPDGSYVTTVVVPSRKVGPKTIRWEGTWQVEDDFLIETITLDSQENGPAVPRTNRFRITRWNDRELALEDPAPAPWAVYPTNQIILLRQTK